MAPAAPAPPLAGVNWDGERFELAARRGEVAIVFFGYTFCPDVCPFTLAKLKQLYAALGERAAEVAVVFVSVDPHRDTVEKLAGYVPNFDRRFYGLRLEFDELDQVQQDWNLTVQYGQPRDGPGSDSYYYVDHTGTYFLVDRQGRLRLTFPPNVALDDLLPDVEALLAEPRGIVIGQARAQVLPGGHGAAYLSIDNGGAEGDRLLAVDTPDAAAAELHETVDEDGVLRMVARPEGFAVPPRTTVALAPGGKHVMLLEPRPEAGRIRLTLRFERAGTIEVTAPVTDVGAMDHGMEGMDSGGMDHQGMDRGGGGR